MKRSSGVLWWIPAISIALLALAEGSMHKRAKRAAVAKAPCAMSELTMDLAGNGKPVNVRLEKIDGDAWADVLVGGELKSTTRVGAWRDDASLEALDVDGDGRADLVRRFDDGGKRVAEVWLSDGNAFVEGWRGPSEAVCVAER